MAQTFKFLSDSAQVQLVQVETATLSASMLPLGQDWDVHNQKLRWDAWMLGNKKNKQWYSSDIND